MVINRYRFYLGPLGLLRALPPLLADARPDAPLSFPGSEHVSLGGRVTQDRGGRVRRRWPLNWDWLTEDDELWLQACLRMSANAPLRMVDPRKRNLLPEDVSTGGSSTRSTVAFTKTGAGALAWTAIAALTDTPTPLQGVVLGRLVWTGATNTGTLYGTTERIPVIAGSDYLISAWVRTTTTFRFSARVFDLAGVEGTPITAPTNNPSTAGVWTRLSWNYTPAGTVYSFLAGLTATGSGNLEVSGMSVQIDQPLADWSFGYGCPEVIVSGPEVAAGYWRTKYHRLGLTLREV